MKSTRQLMALIVAIALPFGSGIECYRIYRIFKLHKQLIDKYSFLEYIEQMNSKGTENSFIIANCEYPKVIQKLEIKMCDKKAKWYMDQVDRLHRESWGEFFSFDPAKEKGMEREYLIKVEQEYIRVKKEILMQSEQNFEHQLQVLRSNNYLRKP